ncbi:DUF7448 domain-containing protein [Micrococcus luteus]|uniref:DUF7448 domain-containing protein n=1 Tax=Micrococcus luteus TaxID=1270 RepID=UPI003D3437BE
MNRYPEETLDQDREDDGTMPGNVDQLREAVVGRRIVKAETRKIEWPRPYGVSEDQTVLTLDDGRQVVLQGTNDCCAFTEMESFWLDPSSVDHVITGVGTTDSYTTWHIYADFGDVMRLHLDWDCGNPFYYGYGFDITVREAHP